jgi:hypothetical protein
MYSCINAIIYVHMYVHVYMYMYIYIYTYITYTYVLIFAHIYTYIYMCTYMYIYTCIYIYIYNDIGQRNIYEDGAVTNASTSNNSYVRKVGIIDENENDDFDDGDFENGIKRRKMDDIIDNVTNSSGVHKDLYPICQSL